MPSFFCGVGSPSHFAIVVWPRTFCNPPEASFDQRVGRRRFRRDGATRSRRDGQVSDNRARGDDTSASRAGSYIK